MSGDTNTCGSDELIRLLEQLPEGVMVLDSNGVIQFANRTGARLIKMKPKKALGTTFEYEVCDGTMRDFDVDMTVKEVTWAGNPAQLLHLKSLKNSGAFHLEWKLESAIERAREAEEALAKLQEETSSGSGGAISSVDSAHYEERIAELESLLELAEVRADELQSGIAIEDHERATELQDAIVLARDAEEQVRSLEEELNEARERIRVAEEQAEVAEERAYTIESELEQALAQGEENQDDSGEVASLSEQVEILQQQVVQLSEELEKAGNGPTSEEFETLQSELGEARSALAEAEDQAAILEQELESAKASAVAGTEELEQALRQQLETSQEELQAVRSTKDELTEKLSQTESEAAQQLEAQKRELEELQDKIGSLEAAVEEKAGEAGQRAVELEAELAEKEKELAAKLDEIEELNEQRELATEESEELAEQLRIEQEQFGTQKTALEEEVAQLRSDLEAAESERDSMLVELEEAAKTTEERSMEAQELAQKVSSLESMSTEADRLKKEIRRLETLLEDAEELAQKGEKVEKLERKLEGALRRAEEAEERLEEERRLLNELKAKVEKSAESREAIASSESNPETERLAFQDELTGLPNRNIIQRYLGFMLKQSSRYSRLTAMLRVDCDNFKTISDTFGVDIGDELIRSVGERLSSVVRGSDVLGRYGEDEFIMLLSEMADQDEASVITAAVIKRLYQKMRKPFSVAGQNVTIGVSVGVSIYPLDAKNGEQMFEHSLVALKRAKETGRGTAQYFTSDLQTAHVARNELDQELKAGLDNDQFEMLYQPIFDLSNGSIVGVESLMRWHHPTHGTLEPDKFLQVAEDSGIIVLIGNWAMRQALENAATWQQAGMRLFVSLNLSRRQLLQADLLPTLQSIMTEVRCSPELLLLEVPEDLTGPEYPKVREALVELQRLGVRLAVDNFGTGSSSLPDLRRGPFQVIKVDRSFTKGIPKNEENMGIVLSALTVGHHLGRISIVVGVENEVQKSWLAQINCRFAQGNFLSEPLKAAQLSDLLKRG